MRRFLIISILTLACVNLQAHEPLEHRVKFNVEWGTMCTTYTNHYFYYLPVEGGVVLDTENKYPFNFTGQIYLGAEFVCTPKLSASLLVGYAGVREKLLAYPILLRANVHPWGYGIKMPYFYGDGGIVVGTLQSVLDMNLGAIGHLGAAYRIPLGHGICLDFKAAARIINYHPDIKNSDGVGYLPRERVRNSQVFAVGAELSIGLSF